MFALAMLIVAGFLAGIVSQGSEKGGNVLIVDWIVVGLAVTTLSLGRRFTHEMPKDYQINQIVMIKFKAL